MVGMMTTPTKKADSPNDAMNGSIAPTRISDRTASSAAAPSRTTIATRPLHAGPAVPGRLAVAAERLVGVRELEDERQARSRSISDDRHQDRFLGERARRSGRCVGQREDGRHEQADEGEHEQRGVRARRSWR